MHKNLKPSLVYHTDLQCLPLVLLFNECPPFGLLEEIELLFDEELRDSK